MAVSTGRGERKPLGSDLLEELKEIGQAIKELQKMKADVNINTSSIEKANKKAKGLSETLDKASQSGDSLNKALGKAGQIRYFATQETMVKQLTQAWIGLNKAQSEAEKKKQKGVIMNWANAYRAMGYDEKKLDKDIFRTADEHYASYEGTRTDGSKYNTQITYSIGELKKVFDQALEQGIDINAATEHWAQRNKGKISKEIIEETKKQLGEIE